MMNKRLITLLLTLCMFIALLVPAYAEQFNDVTTSIGSSYVDAINYMSDNGIIQGWPDGSFRPNVSVSRAMAVTVLFRMSGDGGTYSNASAFTDVSSSSAYYNAIGWAVAKGISNGVTATTFEPDTPVQRQQLMVMMYRFAGYKGYSQTVTENMSSYTDYSSVGNFAKTAVAWAYSYAIPYDGTNSYTINPLGSVPRKDMAVFGLNYRHNVEGIVAGRDNFCFLNYAPHLVSGSAEKYLMSVSDWQVFTTIANANGLYDNTLSVDYLMENLKWGGSCFGMAASLALDYSGIIDLNGNFCNNTPNVYSIPRLSYTTNSKHKQVTTPVAQGSRTISAVESKINLYQLSQYIEPINNWIVKKNAQNSELQKLITGQSHGGIGIFSYTKTTGGGHAINVYGKPVVTSTGYRVSIYDNRYTNTNGYIEVTINNGTYSGTVVNYNSNGAIVRETITYCKYTTAYDRFADYGFDIDGDFNTNNSVGVNSLRDTLTNNTILRVRANGDFSIIDNRGNTLTMRSGEINDTIGVDKFNFIVFGENSACEYLFVVPNSDSYRCVADEENLVLFYAIDSEGIAGTSIYESGGVALSSVDINKTGNVEINSTSGLDIS